MSQALIDLVREKFPEAVVSSHSHRGDDVVTVIVDGAVRMRDRVIPGVDLGTIRAQAQQAGEAVWSRVQEWDPLGRTAEQMSPWSFPLVTDG